MSVIAGIGRLAIFRAEGFAAFTATPQALLNSLAPLVALPIVTALVQIVNGQLVGAGTSVLGAVVALLTPLIVTEAMARLWRVGDRWLRFAVAYCWCQLAFSLVALALRAAQPVFLLLVFYGVALHWFLARHGLGLSRGRATVLVLAADMVTGLLYLGPQLLALPPGAFQHGALTNGVPLQ
jgi:hypothetical protein